MRKLPLLPFALGLVAAVTPPAAARSPFEATATTTLPANNITVSATGNNLNDFVSSIINTTDKFLQLRNQPFNASATFLGVPNAVTFSTNATGTVVTMGLTPINFRKTFTGTSSRDVDDQISRFFEKTGPETVAAFLKEIARRSPIAVTDGNPNAATAVAANSTFFAQGFIPADEIAAGARAATAPELVAPRFGEFGLNVDAGRFESTDFSGKKINLATSGLSIGLGSRVRLLTPLYANYLEVEGARVGGLGAALALPIRFLVMSKDNAWNWRVTPLAGVNARASVDLAGGALLYHGGLLNSVDLRVHPGLVLCLVNQFTAHKSIKLEYGDYSFDPKVDQRILKNGLRVVSPVSSRLTAEFFVVDTRLLKDAAIDQYFSSGGTICFLVSPRFNLRLGGGQDTGGEYKAYHAGLSLAWKW
jgi:hypothetical protein